MIGYKRAQEICSQFNNKKILVFGDVILDNYIFGDVQKISPEAPVPVVKVTREEFRSGGAGNVAGNVDGLGATGIIVGFCGSDGYAREIERLKPDHNYIIKSDHTQTLVKTRIISRRQQIVRVDREEKIRVTAEMADTLRQRLAVIKGAGIDGIIVSDYAKGSLNEEVMAVLQRLAADLGIPVVVDPKPPNFHLYKGISGITPNLSEACAVTNREIAGDDDAAWAVKALCRKFKSRFAIITRGADGITTFERGKKVFHLPAFSHEVFDVTGAGDTVVAVLVLAMVSGASLKEAVALSNAAASIVIEKIGTTAVSVDEIYERLKYLSKKIGGK